MHRCLSIAELLTQICGEIYAFPESRPTLASMGRSCRTFKDVALGVLWREQHSLLPLFRTFPPDLWQKRDSEEGNGRKYVRTHNALGDYFFDICVVLAATDRGLGLGSIQSVRRTHRVYVPARQ
jgi:hypothetical protein